MGQTTPGFTLGQGPECFTKDQFQFMSILDVAFMMTASLSRAFKLHVRTGHRTRVVFIQSTLQVVLVVLRPTPRASGPCLIEQRLRPLTAMELNQFNKWGSWICVISLVSS